MCDWSCDAWGLQRTSAVVTVALDARGLDIDLSGLHVTAICAAELDHRDRIACAIPNAPFVGLR